MVGGAGYVGAVLVQELLERGFAVRVLDRLYFGERGLTGLKDRLELVTGDMRAVDPCLLEDVDTVVNVGGLSNDPTAEYNPRANREMNTVASVKLAQLARTHGVRRYVFASSASIYDRGISDEDRDVVLDETADVDPRAAYSSSKYLAERELLPMASPEFCVVVLRKGTVFGFSPRMRYDLVVNTFVKDALSHGAINLHYGGEMWRPLVDVRDAARAYLAVIQADAARVNGEVFNVVYRNFRISELALRVRETLRELGVTAELRPQYAYAAVRNYRVSGEKIERTLGFRPTVTVEESVRTIFEQVRAGGYTDFENPAYYNIRWMRTLEEAQKVIQVTGGVFDAPSGPPLGEG